MTEKDRTEPGEDDYCDLEPGKLCDNCMKCVWGDSEYRAILVDKIVLPQELKDDATGDA